MEITLTDSKNLKYIQIENFNVEPQRDSNIVVPTVCALLKNNIVHIIHHIFGRIYFTRLKRISRKKSMEGLPENLPELEEHRLIFLLNKANKIPRVQTADVSKFARGFMLQMDFAFLKF